MTKVSLALVFLFLPPLALGAKASKPKSDASRARVIATNGFEIAPLEIGETDATVVQALSMFLPASDGFAPNVSIQIQKYTDTIDEFEKLSRSQFAQFGATVVMYEKSGNTLRGEYTADLQGRKLHFYLRSIHTPEKVYLATATASEAQWAVSSTKLKACVDSFTVPEK